MPLGAPRKFTVESLEKRLNEYFKATPVEEITLTGVCIWLGIYKDTFYGYGRRKEFTDIINMARMRIENSYEVSLKKYGRAGDIFALKNFGWHDKQEVDTKLTGDFSRAMDTFVNKL